MMKRKIKYIASVLLMLCGVLVSCDKGDDPVPTPQPDSDVVELNCVQPGFLKPGDKVALISPSYFTPMENVTKTANVLRSWGLEPVIGPNVGKEDAGKYAGTVQERADDFIAALKDTSIKAILCNRGAYYGKKVLVK